MFIPKLMGSESTYSYAYRLIKSNGMLKPNIFYRYIILESGDFASRKKLNEMLYDLIGKKHETLFNEITKRTLSAPNNQSISSYQNIKADSMLTGIKYCDHCISEQIYLHGHSWFKRDWLFNTGCLTHGKKLLCIKETAKNSKESLFEAFDNILKGSCQKLINESKKPDYSYSDDSILIAPCVLTDYFEKTSAPGHYSNFDIYNGELADIVSLFYQYINCFPRQESKPLESHLKINIEKYQKDSFHLYKSKNSCFDCRHKKMCHFYGDYKNKESITGSDIKNILSSIIQPSTLPAGIGENQIIEYTNLISHINI